MHIYVLYDITGRHPVNPFKVEGFNCKYDSKTHTVIINEGKEKQKFGGCKVLK